MSFAGRVVKGAFHAVRQRLVPPPVIRLTREEHARVFDNQLLLGKNVLVTGAGRNIGRSIALEMARQGANVYFTDLQPERVSNLQSELEASGVRAHGFVSDIGAPAEVDALRAALDGDSVIIDVLVNNVGVHRVGGIQKLTRTDWREIFETNVFGPVQLTQYVVDRLIGAERAGSVLFVTSVHEQSTVGAVAYSATKSALAMIVKELAFELAPHRIRVNAIAPGSVAVIEPDTLPPFPGSALFGASIHPSYIGRAAVYLAADYFSQFTTGSTVTVDAGLLTRPQSR